MTKSGGVAPLPFYHHHHLNNNQNVTPPPSVFHCWYCRCRWYRIDKIYIISIIDLIQRQSDTYTYPKISVPWDPADAIDPNLQRIRDERGYSYADIITVHPDTLPEYDTKVKAFFEEHIHDPRKFGTS